MGIKKRVLGFGAYYAVCALLALLASLVIPRKSDAQNCGYVPRVCSTNQAPVAQIPELPQSKITSLTSDLAKKVDTSTTISGHTLNANISLTENDLTLSDTTANNATSARHGFLPKLPNDPAKCLDGQGNWVVCGGGGGGSSYTVAYDQDFTTLTTTSTLTYTATRTATGTETGTKTVTISRLLTSTSVSTGVSATFGGATAYLQNGRNTYNQTNAIGLSSQGLAINATSVSSADGDIYDANFRSAAVYWKISDISTATGLGVSTDVRITAVIQRAQDPSLNQGRAWFGLQSVYADPFTTLNGGTERQGSVTRYGVYHVSYNGTRYYEGEIKGRAGYTSIRRRIGTNPTWDSIGNVIRYHIAGGLVTASAGVSADLYTIPTPFTAIYAAERDMCLSQSGTSDIYIGCWPIPAWGIVFAMAPECGAPPCAGINYTLFLRRLIIEYK